MRIAFAYDDTPPGPAGAVITNAETGEAIEYVSAIRFEMDARTRRAPVLVVEFWPKDIQIIADAEVRQVCPVCGTGKGRGV